VIIEKMAADPDPEKMAADLVKVVHFVMYPFNQWFGV